MIRKEYIAPAMTLHPVIAAKPILAGSIQVAVQSDEDAGEGVEGLVKSDFDFEYDW